MCLNAKTSRYYYIVSFKLNHNMLFNVAFLIVPVTNSTTNNEDIILFQTNANDHF